MLRGQTARRRRSSAKPSRVDRARHSFLLASQPAALADPTEYY